MSFYGSVYYQLIDAFYKVIIRNKGKNAINFIDGDEDREVSAQGRHGVFGFDSGNRWINFGYNEELKPDSKETYNIYQIYHGRPDPEATLANHGFRAMLEDVESRTDEEGIIQLEPHDVFETYDSIYDDAGHIARSERKVYRLPKSDMDNRVMELERLVGSDAEREMPEMPEGDANLYGYVEENCKDISKLEEYQGQWTVHAAKSWAPASKDNGVGYAPTIAETVGNLNDLYEDYRDRVKNFKSFVEIIGKLAGLEQVTVLEDGAPRAAKNIIDAIVIEKERLDTLYAELNKHQNTSNGAFEGIYSMIGEKIDNDKNIYGHIRQLYSDDSVMRNQLNWSQRPTTTVSGELDSHDLRIKNLEDYRTTLDNVTLPAIDGRVGTLEEQTKEHYEAWAKAEEKFEKVHEDIYAKLGTVPENDNIINIIGDFRGDVSAALGQVPENSNVMSEIQSVENKALSLIGTVPNESNVMSELNSTKDNLLELIGEVPESSNIMSELESTKDNLLELIGEVPESSDVMSELESTKNFLTNLIGEIPEESSVSTELASIQEEVDNLEGIIGTIPEGNTAYGLISTNAGDITDIKEHMGDKVDGKTLSARISENASNMSTLVTTTLPTNYVSKTELTAANYATISDVEKVETALTTVVGDLTNIETLKENATNSEVALLQDIFDRLVALEADVKSIKETLNPPPDEPETGGEDPDIPESGGEDPENPDPGTELEPTPEEGTE